MDNYSVPIMPLSTAENVLKTLEFSELLQILDDRGITLRLNAARRIEVQAKEPPDPALEAALRAHRDALVELLTASEGVPALDAPASPEPRIEPEPPGAVAGDVAEVQPEPEPRKRATISKVKPVCITVGGDTFYPDLSFTSLPYAPY